MSSPLPLPRYLTCVEAADVLRVKPWEVSRLCKAGKLRAVQPGKKWLIDPADLQAYITGSQDAA